MKAPSFNDNNAGDFTPCPPGVLYLKIPNLRNWTEEDREFCFRELYRHLELNEKLEPVVLRDDLLKFEAEHGIHQPQQGASPSEGCDRKPLHTVQKRTYLQVIGGLLKDGYGMDIHADKVSGVTELLRDLEAQGVKISDKTLRTIIKDAAELLPPLIKRR